MPFTLNCDSCDLERSVERAAAAYESARVHEGEHPEHTVLIVEE